MGRIEEIQEMLMREMKRLDKEEIDKEEIARSNALSESACSFIKTVNLGIRIMEVAEHQEKTVKALNKELGVE